MNKLSFTVFSLCALFGFRPTHGLGATPGTTPALTAPAAPASGHRSVSTTSAPGFQLKASIAGGQEGAKVYIRYADVQERKPIDSTVLHNGGFVFKGNFPTPRYCTIFIKDTAAGYLMDKVVELFVENSNITVTAPYDSLRREIDQYDGITTSKALVIKGSKSNDYLKSFEVKHQDFEKKYMDLFYRYIAFHNPKDSTKRQPRTVGMDLARQMDDVTAETKAYIMGFIKEHPCDAVTAYIARRAVRQGTLATDDIDWLIQHFQPAREQAFLIGSFLDYAPSMKKTAIGSAFVDFNLQDTAGNTHTLSSYVGKGKYVLVECWASWCHPCRADIPHLKEVYELYHPYGFEVISVSLDDKKANWGKAIDQEKMPWLQLSDLKAFQGDLPTTYHIGGIPTCLLFDPQGKLVTTNMRGSWMDSRLIKMYGDHFPKEETALNN